MSSGDHVKAHLILPSGTLDYFTIIKVDQSEETIPIYLEEQNIKPQEYSNSHHTSKGFFDEIQDQARQLGTYNRLGRIKTKLISVSRQRKSTTKGLIESGTNLQRI